MPDWITYPARPHQDHTDRHKPRYAGCAARRLAHIVRSRTAALRLAFQGSRQTSTIGGSSLGGVVRAVRASCVLGLCLVSVACGGSDTDSLLVGTWRQTAEEERIGAGPWQPADDACRLDNVEEFSSNGDWTLYDGTFSCGGSSTGPVRGDWRLEAGETKLIFSYDGIGGEYESTIETLSDTTLVVSYATGLTSGLQTRSTYRRQ
jgi:hypothetical protein